METRSLRGSSADGARSKTPPGTPKKVGKLVGVRVLMLDDSVTLFQVQVNLIISLSSLLPSSHSWCSLQRVSSSPHLTLLTSHHCPDHNHIFSLAARVEWESCKLSFLFICLNEINDLGACNIPGIAHLALLSQIHITLTGRVLSLQTDLRPELLLCKRVAWLVILVSRQVKRYRQSYGARCLVKCCPEHISYLALLLWDRTHSQIEFHI